MKLCCSPLPGRWAMCQAAILDEDPPQSLNGAEGPPCGLRPKHPPLRQYQVEADGTPHSSSASGHLPSIQNPVRSPCDSLAPWNFPEVSSLLVDMKRYFAKQKKQCTVFSFVYFA